MAVVMARDIVTTDVAFVDIETCVMTGVTVQGFATRVATCFKSGIATHCFEAGVVSHRFETSVATCFETGVPCQCLLAAVTAQGIVTGNAAFAVTSLHDE